jgi:hypothetical protein
MSHNFIFQVSNNLALIGWLLLIVIPHWRWTKRVIVGILITILSVLYVVYISQSFHAGDFQNFGSLQGIMSLFTNEGAVLAGWIHYLAFDLMVGLFIITNARKNDIKHWVIIPCLLFTFMLGPLGLLLYFIIRFIKTRQYFWEYN